MHICQCLNCIPIKLKDFYQLKEGRKLRHTKTTMNMKMPDFNVKKLVKEAGSTLSRVVQVKFELHIFFLLSVENYLGHTSGSM